MSFLAPAFLAGLAALAVPVLIHLIRRETRRVTDFPSLMFLQRIPVRTMRQQRLRHLLLLALRCLALALLALAFARPFIARRAALAGAPGATVRVVLLDRSWSMGAGARWARAKAAAHAAVRGLGSADRAVLVVFAGSADALTEPTNNRALLDRAIDSLRVSDQGTRYARAIKLAGDVLSRTNLPHREVTLISDFQRHGWSAGDEVRLPAGTVVRTVDVGGDTVADVAVMRVTATRDDAADRATAVVAAQVRNASSAARAVAATLSLGGRALETRTVNIPARGLAQVRFAPSPVPAGASRATVRIAPDALPADDAFHLVLTSDAAVPVLVVEPDRARARQSLYVERVLAIGDRPSFHLTRRSATALRASDFDGQAVVLLNETAVTRGPIADRLVQFVVHGGGLLIVPGTEDLARAPALASALMPARLSAVTDLSASGGTRVAEIAYAHSVFELFSAPHSGDFAAAHVFRYRAAAPVPGSTVIARFGDGAPALVERVVGNGRVLLWTTSIDDYWTDLPMQPVFVPFVHELSAYAARHQQPRSSYTVGDALDVSRLAARTAADGGVVLQAPSGVKKLLGAGSTSVAELTEAGFYELRATGDAPGTGQPIAVNVEAAEADLTPMPPDELVAAVTSRGTEPMSASGQASPPDAERDQSLWWYLVVAALALLVVESVWATRLSGATS